MEEMTWIQFDEESGNLNFVDDEDHYIIQQHTPNKFGVVWLRYPDAFMNFCKTADEAKQFCNLHKKYFAGLSPFVSVRVLDSTIIATKLA